MKPATSWSVKGIDTLARKAAKQAAHERGMTLGQWLNDMILRQAEASEAVTAAEAGNDGPAPEKVRKARSPKQAKVRDKGCKGSKGGKGGKGRRKKKNADISAKLDILAEQLRALTQREQDTAVPRFSPPDENEAMAMAGVIARIERNEQAAAETLADINRRLDELSRRFADQEGRASFPQKPEDVPGYADLETALRNVVDHLELSENRTSEALRSLQKRMDEIAAQVAKASQAAAEISHDEDQAEALAALEERLEELNSRLESMQSSAERHMRAYVDKHMGELAERVNAVHLASQALPDKVESMVSDVTGHKLGQVEQRIEDMVAQLRGKLEDITSGALDVERIGSELDSLGSKLDNLAASAASRNDLEVMRSAIEQLSSTVENKADRSEVQAMEERLQALLAQMEAERSEGGSMPQISALEQKVQELEAAMREFVATRDDPESVTRLEKYVGALDSRLAQAEERLAYLPTLENSIARLSQSLENNAEQARAASEETARRFMGENGAGKEMPAEAHGDEINALREGLEAVKASAEASDQRTQETLVAVHETLQHIIEKLNELESAAMAENREPEATAATESDKQDAAEATASSPFDAGRMQEDGGTERAVRPDPLDVAAAVRAAEQAHGETLGAQAPGDISTGADPEEEIREDFIAAARRAAMTASGESSTFMKDGASGLLGRLRNLSSGATKGDANVTASDTQIADADSKKSGFNMSFLNRGDKKGKVDDGSGDGGKRRRLILAGLVLLAAVSAYMMNGQAKKPRPHAMAPAVTAPADMAGGKAKTSSTERKAPQARPTPAMEKKQAGLSLDLGAAGSLGSPLAAGDHATMAKMDSVTTASLNPLRDAAARSTNGPRAIVALPPELGTPALRLAASSGDAKAQFIIGSLYLEGRRVKRDFAKAAQWFEKAAAQGLTPAQYRLGTLYERGRGVPRDATKAQQWYEKAAREGNVKAMHNLAVLLADNSNGKADFSRAARWFQAAAEHGLRDSQYNLAALYQRGLGVTRDLAQAYYWFGLAARQGDIDAPIRMANLKNHVAPEKLAEMQERIARWTAKKASRTANLVTIDRPEWKIGKAGIRASAKSAERLAPVAEKNKNLSHEELIRQTQMLLSRLGFDPGPQDGRMGNRTANAIRLFQLQSGLPVDGKPSQQVLRLLQARSGNSAPSA